MARWDAGAGDRLKQAAMTLYLERGYAKVTVAEIADRAGLTKRTFFRHFPDKREVLFAGAQGLQDDVVAAVVDAADDCAPIDAVVTALLAGSTRLTEQYAGVARQRSHLIASSPELQERELIKTAQLTQAIAQALRHRGTNAVQAMLTAHAGVAVFTTAYDQWIDDQRIARPRPSDLPTLVHNSLNQLRRAIC